MDGPVTLASSLAVPHVQALAASLDASSEIPDRYIRSDLVETDPIVMIDDADIELPVVDLRRAQLSREECAKIMGAACEEWGFFQLINHGVARELIEEMTVDITKFFKLPMEEKESCAQLPEGLQGYGQLFVKSEEQKLDWGDVLSLTIRPVSKRDMRFWPTSPPTFRETLDSYTSALKEVARCLLRLMAGNLGLDPEIMMSNFTEMQQFARINYYPPCPQVEKVIGLSPHSDATGLTILHQASDVHGLQIRKNDRWYSVKPLPGAFVVNIGDLLEIFSNGKYKSIEHRAVVNAEKARLSIALFHAPDHDCVIRPFPQLVDGGVEKYKTSTWEDYMKAFFSAKLDAKNHLESMKLK